MTIAQFDHLPASEKSALLFQCCGSGAWVQKMMAMPPVEDLIDLFEDAEEKWYECSPDDWKEAFAHHPRIGDLDALKKRFAQDPFVSGEQSSVTSASEAILTMLAQRNREYEEKFGYIFIVCATGKSAAEMLEILNSRIDNSPEEEIRNAMDEQSKITKLRLEKLFQN